MLNKETKELLDLLLALISQGIDSFKDGASLKDLPDFMDEVILVPGAIEGLAANFSKEAAESTPLSIDRLFNDYQEILTGKGTDPITAYMIISGLKTVYAGISLAAKAKQNQISS